MIRTGPQPRDRERTDDPEQPPGHAADRRDPRRAATRDLIFELHRPGDRRTLDDPSAAGRFRTDDEYRVVGDEFGEVFHRPPPAGQLRSGWPRCALRQRPGPLGFIHPVIRSMPSTSGSPTTIPSSTATAGRPAPALLLVDAPPRLLALRIRLHLPDDLRGPSSTARPFSTRKPTTTTSRISSSIISTSSGNAPSRSSIASSRVADEQLRALERDVAGMAELNHRQRKLIRHALRHPASPTRSRSHRQAHGVVYQTARTDLLDLEPRGLVSKTESRARLRLRPRGGPRREAPQAARRGGGLNDLACTFDNPLHPRGQTFNYRPGGAVGIAFFPVSRKCRHLHATHLREVTYPPRPDHAREVHDGAKTRGRGDRVEIDIDPRDGPGDDANSPPAGAPVSPGRAGGRGARGSRRRRKRIDARADGVK